MCLVFNIQVPGFVFWNNPNQVIQSDLIIPYLEVT